MGTYCYLCAYGTKRVPPKSHRLPSGSGAQPTDELASCHGCGVLACSQHGRRVSLFKCALCDGVDVTDAVLNSNAAAAPELNPAPFPEFERTGLAASGRVMQQAIVALEAIRAAQDRIATSFNLDDRAWTEPFQEVSSNNIVLDLDTMITQRAEESGFDLANSGLEPGTKPLIDLGAIAADVRSRYALTQAWVDERAARLVLGAVVRTYLLADEEAHGETLLSEGIRPHPVRSCQFMPS